MQGFLWVLSFDYHTMNDKTDRLDPHDLQFTSTGMTSTGHDADKEMVENEKP
jgi:hypothetical protein